MTLPAHLRLSPGEALVAVGANLGDRRGTIDRGLAAIAALEATTVLAVSRWHETAPVGPAQPDYLNGVVRIATGLGPHTLLDALLGIERGLGRVRDAETRWGPRTLDLDLIAFGDLMFEDDRLTLPHPRADDRLFVLEPLADLLDPDSVAGRSLAMRLAQLRRGA